MQLGLFFDLRNPPVWRRPWADHYARAIEVAEEAERLGCASAWATEHHFFEDGYLPQPLTFLSALAARTTAMRLGTAVVLAALRHPRHLAEEAAVVDLVSGGRLELGIGAGWASAEYAAFGADIERRMSLTDAATREVRDLLWGGELLPPPVQQQVPVWLGYQGPKGARRAGRLGVGLLATNRASLAPYREGLVEGGHDPSLARMGGVVDLIVADDPERTARRLAPYAWYQRASYAAVRDGGPVPPHADDDELELVATQLTDLGSRGLVVAGVDDAAHLLTAHVEGLPVTHLYLWASVAGMPDDLVAEHLALAFGKVAPLVRARSVAG